MEKPVFTLSLVCAALLSFAQSAERQVIAALGGDHPLIEWTIGESVTGFYTADDVQLSEGFHQSTIVRVEAVTQVIPAAVNPYRVFPNPFREGFHITGSPNAAYQLAAADGRIILQQQHLHEDTYVDLSQLATGTYFLRLVHDDSVFQYQVIKSHP